MVNNPLCQKLFGDGIRRIKANLEQREELCRPICDRLGINFDAQRWRINRDAILSDEAMPVVVTTIDIKPSSRRPRTSKMIALPLDMIGGFLFGINASRVKPEMKERLIRY